MGRVAAEIERAVRAAPHQWFVFRELWPETTPVNR
jgi:predicted LPLAT superfamily acyltransferase